MDADDVDGSPDHWARRLPQAGPSALPGFPDPQVSAAHPFGNIVAHAPDGSTVRLYVAALVDAEREELLALVHEVYNAPKNPSTFHDWDKRAAAVLGGIPAAPASLPRYALFATDDLYPAGGWDDFLKAYDSKEEALAAGAAIVQVGAKPRMYDDAHVVDLRTGERLS